MGAGYRSAAKGVEETGGWPSAEKGGSCGGVGTRDLEDYGS